MYFTRTNRDFLSDFLPKKMPPLQEEMRRPASRARLARVAELRSPRFIGFMDELNRFARRFELQEYVDFSKNWEYPWLWFNGLQEIIRPGVKVLDIGSEMSPMPWYFASRGARVTLVEQHSHLHERWNRIRERLAVCVDWKVSHAESLPLEEGSFDVVTSLSVIEHQADKRQAINEMLRVLREGGLLGLSFDLCESKYGMSYPDWNGFPLSLDRFEQLLWNHEEVATGGFELEWNEDDIEDFLAWHRTTADHHTYVVGAGILQKRGNPLDRVRVRR